MALAIRGSSGQASRMISRIVTRLEKTSNLLTSILKRGRSKSRDQMESTNKLRNFANSTENTPVPDEFDGITGQEDFNTTQGSSKIPEEEEDAKASLMQLYEQLGPKSFIALMLNKGARNTPLLKQYMKYRDSPLFDLFKKTRKFERKLIGGVLKTGWKGAKLGAKATGWLAKNTLGRIPGVGLAGSALGAGFGKLKGMFKKKDEDEDFDEEDDKEGFFSRIFGRKKSDREQEVEDEKKAAKDRLKRKRKKGKKGRMPAWVSALIPIAGVFASTIWNMGKPIMKLAGRALVAPIKWLGSALWKGTKSVVSGVTSAISGLLRKIPGVGALMDKTKDVATKAKNVVSKATKKVGSKAALRVGAKVFLRAGLIALGPVGAAIGIGMLAYDAYKIYQWYKETKASNGVQGKLVTLRMLVYGLNDKLESSYSKILTLEKLVSKKVTYKSGNLTFDLNTEEKEAAMEIFEVDMESPTERNRFQRWFNWRFIPGYRAFYRALKFSTGERGDITKPSSIKETEIMGFLNAYILPTNALDIEDIPISPGYRATSSREEIDELIKELKNTAEEIKKKNDIAKPPPSFPKDDPKDKKDKSGGNNSGPTANQPPPKKGFLDRVTDAVNSYLNGNKAEEGLRQYSSSEVMDAIDQASARVPEVNRDYLISLAKIESSLNPNAKAKTSAAAGLYQFIPSTWKSLLPKLVKEFGIPEDASPFDPYYAALGAAYMAREDYKGLRGLSMRHGDADKDTRMYLNHFLGLGTSKRVLKAYDEGRDYVQMRDLVSSGAMKANKELLEGNNLGRFMGLVRNKLTDAKRTDASIYLANNAKAAAKDMPTTATSPLTTAMRDVATISPTAKGIMSKPEDVRSNYVIANQPKQKESIASAPDPIRSIPSDINVTANVDNAKMESILEGQKTDISKLPGLLEQLIKITSENTGVISALTSQSQTAQVQNQSRRESEVYSSTGVDMRRTNYRA